MAGGGEDLAHPLGVEDGLGEGELRTGIDLPLQALGLQVDSARVRGVRDADRECTSKTAVAPW